MKDYEIQNSEGATLVVQLDDKTAKEIGAKPVASKSKTPANKARTAANKKS